ncbi:MAG: amidohydrolase [Candidatus Heimdallarchaeota archaeon]|nr:amidohydrolase [Candidatus Heimdallarchaeota archaeon]
MSDVISIQAKWMLGPDNETLRDKHVITEGGKISYIGGYDSSLVPRDAVKLHYPRGLIVPPFINAHTHLPETLIRGLIDDADLHEWLFNHVWKVEPKMLASDARVGAQLGIAEMFKTGTIGFVDQYFYSDEIAQVVIESGAKAFLAPSIFPNTPEHEKIEDSYTNNLRMIEKWHGKDNRLFFGFGPHAPYTVGEDLYLKIYEQASKYDTFIHTHLHETKREVEEAQEKYGKSSIQSFADIGILDRIFAAHCIHMDAHDRELMLKNHVTILHNLQSNLKIGAGIAPIPEYLAMGLNVTLGTDGSASNNNLDMLEEVRLTALLHKGLHHDPKIVNTITALNLGTRNASKLFPEGVYSGIIDVGRPADLVVVDLSSVNMTPVINPLSNWIYSGNGSDVVLTMVNGKLVYQDGELLTLNERRIKESAQESTERMMADADYTAREFS